MYRVLRPLSTGQKRGDLIFAGDLKEKVIEPLKKVRAITEFQPPPLSVLPGWKERAKILGKYNIQMADEFIEARNTLLRFILRESPEIIEQWKEEVIELIK